MCELHDIFVTIVVLLFIINFELSLIGGVEPQLTQILCHGGAVIGPTHSDITYSMKLFELCQRYNGGLVTDVVSVGDW
jgi:hypothetical protein